MDNLLTVAFEAHNVERNHHRRYQVTVGCDLLDDWTVAIRYGRTGQGGRELRYAAAAAEKMQVMIRERLRRRLSAPKRIGCPYRLAAFSTAPGFDASAWLPAEIMARFFLHLEHAVPMGAGNGGAVFSTHKRSPSGSRERFPRTSTTMPSSAPTRTSSFLLERR